MILSVIASILYTGFHSRQQTIIIVETAGRTNIRDIIISQLDLYIIIVQCHKIL